jgi:hypothetical protein
LRRQVTQAQDNLAPEQHAERYQVEDVTLARRGEQAVGTLHLTPHHLIFVHTPRLSDASAAGQAARPRELWITYPIVAFCTLRTAPAASRQPSSIRLRCRDFTFVCFYFSNESKARDVYDSIRAWTCKIGRIEKLYAFAYQPQLPEKDISSWGIYDPMKEWRRMGVGDESRKTNWRISSINADYAVRLQTSHFVIITTDSPSSPQHIPPFWLCLWRYQTTRSIMLAVTGQEHEYQL